MREHKIGGENECMRGVRKFICDERRRLDVEMNVGKPLLHIETWTLLVNIGEISMA